MEGYLRSQIVKHFRMRDKIETAVNKVLHEDVSLEDIKRNLIHYTGHVDNIRATMDKIKRTVKLVQKKEEYFEKKYMYLAAIKDYNEGMNKSDIVRKYEIHRKTFNNKLSLYKKHGDVCNWKVSYKMNFGDRIIYRLTYEQEEMLLRPLRHWAETPFDKTSLDPFDKFCTCRVCCLEILSEVALRFVIDYNIKHDLYWDNIGGADIDWLQEFDMKYDISKFSYRYCYRYNVLY